MIKKFLENDIVERALKTFVQGFVAYLIISVDGLTNFTDMEVIKAILLGAVASGLSAMWNYIKLINNK